MKSKVLTDPGLQAKILQYLAMFLHKRRWLVNEKAGEVRLSWAVFSSPR